MSLVSDVITSVRREISDDDSVRWQTDAPILAHVKRAVNRANHILIRNGIHFAKSSSAFSTADGTATYALPSDFGSPISLYNRTTTEMLCQITDHEYEMQLSPPVSSFWRISGTDIEIVDTPNSIDSMILYYWPLLATSDYTTASTMPWGGKCDDAIVEYVSIRLKNIDEQKLTLEPGLLDEFERNIINVYSQLEPVRNVEGFIRWH